RAVSARAVSRHGGRNDLRCLMSATAESPTPVPQSLPEVSRTTPSDRLGDIDAKQARIIALLQEIKGEVLLVRDSDDAARVARGILEPNEMPAIYFNPEGRWVLCSNVDSQRLFDEELDGLGFQLKEWPWHWGRAQLLADLCQGRTVACDQPVKNCKSVASQI